MDLKRRDFPIIKLAPWEHLPGCAADQIEARAQNVEPFEWHGHTMQLAARFAEVGDGARYLFLRDVLSQDEGNWVLAHGSHVDGPQQIQGAPPLKLPGRLAAVKGAHSLPFGRLFHLGREELGVQKPWRAFVAPNGSGCWLETHKTWPDYHPFQLPRASFDSKLQLAVSEVKALLLAQTRLAGSDARFAFDWAHLTEFEKEDSVLCVRRGSVAELRELLKCAFKIQPELQKHNALWNWEVESQQQVWSSLSFYNASNPAADFVSVPLRLQLWRREILAFFLPTFDTQLHRRHVCISSGYTDNFGSLLHLEIQTPTHHERLEAALQLRDWAQDKIAPRKLKLLLGSV